MRTDACVPYLSCKLLRGHVPTCVPNTVSLSHGVTTFSPAKDADMVVETPVCVSQLQPQAQTRAYQNKTGHGMDSVYYMRFYFYCVISNAIFLSHQFAIYYYCGVHLMINISIVNMMNKHIYWLNSLLLKSHLKIDYQGKHLQKVSPGQG